MLLYMLLTTRIPSYVRHPVAVARSTQTPPPSSPPDVQPSESTLVLPRHDRRSSLVVRTTGARVLSLSTSEPLMITSGTRWRTRRLSESTTDTLVAVTDAADCIAAGKVVATSTTCSAYATSLGLTLIEQSGAPAPIGAGGPSHSRRTAAQAVESAVTAEPRRRRTLSSWDADLGCISVLQAPALH